MIDFRKLKRSNSIGGKFYSDREDYIEFLSKKYNISKEEVLENDELVIELTQNWFKQGQVGCGFAKYMAGDSDRFGWRFIVEKKSEYTKSSISKLYSKIKNHIQHSGDEVLSILFPHINSDISFAELIKSLVEHTPFFIDNVQEYSEKLILISLRLDISGNKNNSWIMALGPFDDFPKTRQCPVTQIVIRLKVKDTERMYHEAKNVSDAHNADMPVDMIEPRKQDALWELSFKNTERVLGHKPDNLSAAKYTCPIPKDIYINLFKGNL